MKTHDRILTVALTLCVGLFTAAAAEKKVEAGPKGGRILEKTNPKVEFVVEKDHSVTVAFYSADLKPVAVTDQRVTVVADKTKLEFEKKGDVLVSKAKLPEGDGYNVVVQFKQTAEAKQQNFRFKLDLSNCGGCNRPEYACTCGH